MWQARNGEFCLPRGKLGMERICELVDWHMGERERKRKLVGIWKGGG